MTDKEQIEEIALTFCPYSGKDIYGNCRLCISGKERHCDCFDKAKILTNKGYHKTVWHKVADGDLPKRRDGEICAIPVQAYYVDRNGIKGNGPLYYFFVDNTFHSIGVPDAVNVIAWTELPKYEE